ncbi:hypothetical protein [Wolbachia endosymbiont (group A) of Ennomos erosarius]
MFIANIRLSTNFVKHNKWCHSSAPFFVIPVLDTALTTVIPLLVSG